MLKISVGESTTTTTTTTTATNSLKEYCLRLCLGLKSTEITNSENCIVQM